MRRWAGTRGIADRSEVATDVGSTSVLPARSGSIHLVQLVLLCVTLGSQRPPRHARPSRHRVLHGSPRPGTGTQLPPSQVARASQTRSTARGTADGNGSQASPGPTIESARQRRSSSTHTRARARSQGGTPSTVHGAPSPSQAAHRPSTHALLAHVCASAHSAPSASGMLQRPPMHRAGDAHAIPSSQGSPIRRRGMQPLQPPPGRSSPQAPLAQSPSRRQAS